MFLRWKQPFPNSYLCTFSTLVFHLAAVFLLLVHCCGGQSQMVGSPGPILAMLGEDTTLPCHLEPATDVTAGTVEWARSDLKPRFVHLWRDGVEIPMTQHQSYVGRTSLSTDKLKQGDISLKLLNVKLSDEGEYRCHIPEVATSVVWLAVGAASFSVHIKVEANKTTSRVVLQCQSAGWYPEPEVVWLDGERNLLPAGPAETLGGPDGLFSISSRVTVEQSHNNKYMCRVQQKDINQTRSTEIQIPDEVFMDSACSAARIMIVMVSCLGFMLSSVVLFALWKREQRKQKKMQPDDDTDGTEEMEQLVEGNRTSKNLDEEMAKLEEKLKDKKKEKETILDVIAVLTGDKIERTNFRHDKQTELEEMEKKHMQNEKQLRELEDKNKRDKTEKKCRLLEVKVDLESRRKALQPSLENNEAKLKKTEDGIRMITGIKEELDDQIKLIKAHLEETKRQRGEEPQQPSV